MGHGADGAHRRNNGFYEVEHEAPREPALLVGVHISASRPGAEPTWADLDELERLAETAGADVLGRIEQRRDRPDIRSLVGKGKLESLQRMKEAVGAKLIIFDNDLSPAQGRNLEKALECRVVDRTELILDIFARHARTKRSRLQVSLAQYEYLLPRLVRMWKHLERQAGGIGTRGPGESQLETDRRIIGRRMAQVRRELRVIDKQMQTQRKRRQQEFRVALAGYTNAGKSSLMNHITDAGVYVRDELFATLDATTRRVDLEGGHHFLLSDTVGFIRKLPHHLVESFRATLSEVDEADLMLHVVDASSEDYEGNIEAVHKVLGEVCGDDAPPQLLVFNKVDQLDDAARESLAFRYPDALLTSASTGEGIEALLDAILERLRQGERELELRVDSDQPRTVARLYELGEVLAIEYEPTHTEVRVRVDGPSFGQVMKLPGVELVEMARYRAGG